MKNISSKTTFVYKYIYPLAFCIAGILMVNLLSVGEMLGKDGQALPSYFRWIILTGGGIAAIWAMVQAVMIKSVLVDGEKLRVAGFWRVEEICFKDIERIAETRFRNPKLIIIHLRNKSKSGRKVRFIPAGKGVFLGTHPVVEMLAKKLR